MLIIEKLVDALPCHHCGNMMDYCLSYPYDKEFTHLTVDEIVQHPQSMHYIRCSCCDSGFSTKNACTKQGLIDLWNARDPILLQQLREWRKDYLKQIPEIVLQLTADVTKEVNTNHVTHRY